MLWEFKRVFSFFFFLLLVFTVATQLLDALLMPSGLWRDSCLPVQVLPMLSLPSVLKHNEQREKGLERGRERRE